MKPKAIRLCVIGFILVQLCVGCFCFYCDAYSANWLMTHVYEDYYGRSKNVFRIGHEALWFPAGPLSGLLWAVPFYGALKIIAWRIHRRRTEVDFP